MKTRIAVINDVNDPALLWGAELIRTGDIVAFPTETVYGLGGSAFDAQAIEKIYIAKGRPSDNPLIVHIAAWEQLSQVAAAIPDKARLLAARFWPGPLTMIFPKGPEIAERVTAGLDTVAVRMPRHPVAQALIKASGVPIAAPSANTSGKPSPTKAAHVAADLYGRIRLILDGGETSVGLESTVLDLCGEVPLVLRPGGVTVEQLRQILGEVRVAGEVFNQQNKPRSPGMKYTHYKPEADVVLVQGEPARIVVRLRELQQQYRQQGKKVGIMATTETAACYQAEELKVMGSRSNPEEIAASIFDLLRQFDETDVDIILAEGLPPAGIGLAIMNRLSKASGYHIINC